MAPANRLGFAPGTQGETLYSLAKRYGTTVGYVLAQYCLFVKLAFRILDLFFSVTSSDPGKIWHITAASLNDVCAVKHDAVSMLVFPGAEKFRAEIGLLPCNRVNVQMKQADHRAHGWLVPALGQRLFVITNNNPVLEGTSQNSENKAR